MYWSIAEIITVATTSGSAATSGLITFDYPTSRTGSSAGCVASAVQMSDRILRSAAP
jgi:hypothetical protein